MLSNGHQDDKRFGIFTLNGMGGSRRSWAAETRQWRQDELYRALRPLLTIAMDAAAGHMSSLERCYSLQPGEWSQTVLAGLKVRTMLFLENLCRRLSAAPATVIHHQANQQLLGWINMISTAWVQLWSNWFLSDTTLNTLNQHAFGW